MFKCKKMTTTNNWRLIRIVISLSAICSAAYANSVGTLHGLCRESSTGAPCQTLHSVCVNKMCQCASPYSPRNGACVFTSGEATVNNACASNSDCQGQGEFCNYGFCQCLRTYVEIDRHCFPVVYPGQSGCDDGRQCAAAFPGASCKQRYCECPSGSTAEGQTCVQNGLGKGIESSSNARSGRLDYAVEVASRRSVNSDIRSHRLRGLINYQSMPVPQISSPVISSTALGTVSPGGVCSQDKECAGYPFAYCMSTCMCRDGAINAGSTCLEPGSTAKGNCGTSQVYVSEAGACMNTARPGEPCQYSQQCSGSEVGAFCVNLRCRCVYGMVVTGDGRCTFINSNCTTRGTVWISELGECKPVIAPGARTCTHRQQCIASYPDSMCFLTQCTCPEGQPVAVDGTCGTSCLAGQTFSGVLGKCVPTVQPGDRCHYSSQCHAIYPGMICDKGVCRCPNSQMWTGSACSSNCPAGYTMNLKSGMCRPVCRSNQIDFESECLDLTGPGLPCRVNQQCQGGATCVNRVCTCPRGTQNTYGTCSRAFTPPGGPCNAGEYCIGGSYCDNDICNCPLGTVKSNQQCVTPVNVPPNSPCGPAAKCSGNSVCINNACVCPEGQIPVNGFCTIPPSVPPGYPCSPTDRCTLGSVCQGNICQCPTGTFLNENRCLVPMQVPPGAACRSGTELCTGLSLCVNNICSCPAGMVAQGAMCRTPALGAPCCATLSTASAVRYAFSVSPGSSCASQERCGGGSECVDRVCACPPGTKIINLQCQFVASVPPNLSCANGEICIGGSHCQDNICRCPTGQAAFNQVCQYSSAGAGAPCMTNEQCTGGSMCVSNVCTCRLGQVWSNGNCLASNAVPPGAPCHDGANCTGGSRCIGDVCTCRSGDVIRRNECVSIRVLSPGSPCLSADARQECAGGSACVNGTCECPAGAAPFRDKCVRRLRVPPLSSCAGGETCTGGAVCQNAICTCPSGMVVRNQECARPEKVPPGSPCPSGSEVCAGGSSCINNICRCPTGQVIRDQVCSSPPTVPYNFLCARDGECVGGASCIGGLCVCPNSTLLVDGICQAPVAYNLYPTSPLPITQTTFFVGAFCSDGEGCLGGSVCEKNVCVCPGGSVPVGNHCVKAIVKVPPGSACANGEQCGGGSVCINNVCVCPPSYTIVNGACRPAATVPPTASCANGEQCSGGSSCIRDVCTCPSEQVVINQRCQDPPVVSLDPVSRRRQSLLYRGKRALVEWSEPLPDPGSACAPTQMCLGGASCVDGYCKCPDGTSIISGRCVALQAGRMANPGETCTPLDVCTGGSYCLGALCVCPPGRGVQGFSCVTLVVGPGFSCANAERCCGGSRCVNRVCACPAGMIITEDLIQCTPAVVMNRDPGQPCDFGSVCTGGSWCQNNICQCPTGQTAQQNTCIPSTNPAVPPGAACAMGQTSCGGGSFCLDDRCACGADSVVQNDMCVTSAAAITVPPGGPCTLGVTTCTGNSFCSNVFCVCQPGQIVLNQACVFETASDAIGMPPGSACVLGQTACGGGSFCVSNVCICPQGQSVVNARCVGAGGQNVAQPGDSCDFGTTCLGGSACQNNRCVCPLGQMLVHGACQDAGLAAVPPGGPCVLGITMCGGESVCVNNVCTCPTGKVANNQVCSPSWTSNFAPPGSSCNAGTTCTGGSLCTNNVCTCPLGLIVQNEICIPSDATVPPGGSCAGFVVICGGGSYCNIGICTCPAGTYAQDGQCNRQPGNWAFPAQHCLPSTPCIGGSSCIGAICTCPENQAIAHNECVPKHVTVLPGLTCDANSICLGDSSCVNNVCRCPPGQMEENGQCVMKSTAVPPGYPCIPGSSSCMGGSYCISDRCVCINGQVIVNNQCVSAPGRTRDPQNPNDQFGNNTEARPFAVQVPPGAACLADGTGCGGGSACVNGKCVCGTNQVVLNGICSLDPVTVPPGSSCDSSNQCPFCRVSCGGGSTCTFGSCVCENDETVENGRCVPGATVLPASLSLQAVPGSKCDWSTMCGGGSACKNGICTCPEGAVVNTAMQCVPQFGGPQPDTLEGLELGALCVPGQAPCAGLAICQNHYCVCPETAVVENARCVPPTPSNPVGLPAPPAAPRLLPPGSPCNISNVPATLSGVVCGFGSLCAPPGICTCPQGWKIVAGQCVPGFGSGNPAPLGSFCASDVTTCAGNSTCIDGICACGESDIIMNGLCMKAYDQGKEVNAVSAARGPVGLRLGSPCSIQSICAGGAVCIAEICTCPTGTTVADSICVPESGGVPPGNPCDDTANCIGGATCQTGLCTCPSDEEPNGDRCVEKWKTVPPASPCAESTVCGNGSYCFNGFCICPPGHSIQSGQCVPDGHSVSRSLKDLIEKSAPPGSWCGGAVICNGGSYCYNNVCTCPFGQLIVNLQCAEAPIVPPGSSCLNGEVCGGGSVCSQGKCACPAGTTQSGKNCKNIFMSARTQNCPLPETPSACALPDCYCSRTGTEIPGNLSSSDTPQMVVLTVDDALNGRTMSYIRRIFENGRFKNPNGCEIKATFFISHEWNNYDEVQWLYFNGHEIAVNSMTHQTLSNETVERWSLEMNGMRTILQQLSGIPVEAVKGVRAPQLAIGGNSQFEMMRQDGFQYDNSMSANPGKNQPAYWPQTLDFQFPWRCEIESCPDRPFAGIWVIPINQFYGYYLPEIQDHKRGAMVRAVMADAPEETVDTLYNTLLDNFNRVYRTNRAPYVLTLDAAFFQTLPNNGSVEALERFITQILSTPDVWMVTEQQVLEWMKKPTATSQLSSFLPWQCGGGEQQRQRALPPCETPRRCSYQTQLPFGERWFKTCFTCPSTYPWLNNPTGTRRK